MGWNEGKAGRKTKQLHCLTRSAFWRDNQNEVPTIQVDGSGQCASGMRTTTRGTPGATLRHRCPRRSKAHLNRSNLVPQLSRRCSRRRTWCSSRRFIMLDGKEYARRVEGCGGRSGPSAGADFWAFPSGAAAEETVPFDQIIHAHRPLQSH